MGDCWEHEIRLVRDIGGFDLESPRLLEAAGQAPPEDVGWVSGFLEFRRIMLDPLDPEYARTKEWAGYWKPELDDYSGRPGLISRFLFYED